VRNSGPIEYAFGTSSRLRQRQQCRDVLQLPHRIRRVNDLEHLHWASVVHPDDRYAHWPRATHDDRTTPAAVAQGLSAEVDILVGDLSGGKLNAIAEQSEDVRVAHPGIEPIAGDPAVEVGKQALEGFLR